MPEWVGIVLLLWLWGVFRTLEATARLVGYIAIEEDGFSQKTLQDTAEGKTQAYNDWEVCWIYLGLWPFVLWMVRSGEMEQAIREG